MNSPVCSRAHFVAGPLLDGKPVELSKDGSDVIWVLLLLFCLLLLLFSFH